MRVMDEVVHVAPQHLVRLEAQHARASAVNEDAAPIEVDAVDSITGRLEQQLELPSPGGVMGEVMKVREHRRPPEETLPDNTTAKSVPTRLQDTQQPPLTETTPPTHL